MTVETSGQASTGSTTPATTPQASGGSAGGGVSGGGSEQSAMTPEQHASAQSAQAASIPQEYKLNAKYKVTTAPDTQVEREFDPWIREAIKDADTEKKVRELYEKAHGLDFVKSTRKQAVDRLTDIEPKYTAQSERIQYLDGLLTEGNIGAFQREIGIPDEQILLRAKEIIQKRENPELAQHEDNSFQTNQRIQELQRQNRALVQQQGQTLLQELSSTLAKPDVASYVQQYDAKFGVGAFQKKVIELGAYYQTTLKQSKSPGEIISELTMFAAPVAPQAPALEMVQDDPAQANAPTAPARKPVIPNINGRGTSPVKKEVGSIADLRNRHKELVARN